MIEIAQIAARAVASATPATAPALPVPQADAGARFTELMSTTTPTAEPAPIAAAIPQAIAQAYPAGEGSLGDRILRGLNRVQSSFGETVSAVQKSLDPGAPAPGVSDLLRLQLSMAQLSLQAELVGKVIGRSTQNIDQLVRMQ